MKLLTPGTACILTRLIQHTQ